MRSPKNKLPYEVGEDTIYGVDFSGGIADALSRSDYREAVRLLYLQTLKRLSDEKRIDWQPYKTPTQYINEEGQGRCPGCGRNTARALPRKPD